MNDQARLPRRLLPWAGFLPGPVAWLVNTQLGQILPYAECGGGFRASILVSFLGAGLSLLGAFLSWRGAQPPGASRFVGGVGACFGLVIAFALLLQGAAAMVLSGCER
ncbi:hypothetical protein [Roseomonas marmotae]|uniref:Uncharacterized protein n=1 Tax=Roseomonas marmotae TaxID=2768161 RepID=A0ABS3KDJ0_9PROT|nr:hypothetical protein [Roseomonas marmotae]MBO1075507.1 hypothetical protein [Roseomonas marmotae]QTI81451.1 hypothetical protein IAI58_19085 [Roseomonas marmotae]